MRQVNVHPLSFLINYIFFHLITSMYFFTQEKTTQINLFNFFTANDKSHQGADKHAEETKTWKKKKGCWLNELQGIIKCLIFILVWSFDKVLITYLLELKKHLKGVYSFPLLHAQVEPLWLLSL